MGVIVKSNKLVIIEKPKTINFDLFKDFDNNMNNRINFTIKHNKGLVERTIKYDISQLLTKYKNKIQKIWYMTLLSLNFLIV